jgi:hypothetical protein
MARRCSGTQGPVVVGDRTDRGWDGKIRVFSDKHARHCRNWPERQRSKYSRFCTRWRTRRKHSLPKMASVCWNIGASHYPGPPLSTPFVWKSAESEGYQLLASTFKMHNRSGSSRLLFAREAGFLGDSTTGEVRIGSTEPMLVIVAAVLTFCHGPSSHRIRGVSQRHDNPAAAPARPPGRSHRQPHGR